MVVLTSDTVHCGVGAQVGIGHGHWFVDTGGNGVIMRGSVNDSVAILPKQIKSGIGKEGIQSAVSFFCHVGQYSINQARVHFVA